MSDAPERIWRASDGSEVRYTEKEPRPCWAIVEYVRADLAGNDETGPDPMPMRDSGVDGYHPKGARTPWSR